MKTIKRTKQDYLNLLDETVKYYSEDVSRRAVDNNGSCRYFIKTDNKHPEYKVDPVGRCLKNSEKYRDLERGVYFLFKKFSEKELLKQEYLGYDVDFWGELQELHDPCHFWNKDGLSDYGLEKVENIKKYIETNYN